MKFAAIPFLILVLTSLALADEKADCQDLNRFWQDTASKDFKAFWPNRRFTCDSTNGKIAQAFRLLWLSSRGENFYRWAKEHVSRTIYSRKCSSNRTVSQISSSNRILEICPHFLDISEASRAGAIFHEAAHTRVKDPGHVTCEHGVHKNLKGTCDSKFFGSYKGSGYNFEFQYLWRVLHQVKHHPLSEIQIRSALKSLAWNKFNQVDPKVMKLWLEERSPSSRQ